MAAAARHGNKEATVVAIAAEMAAAVPAAETHGNKEVPMASMAAMAAVAAVMVERVAGRRRAVAPPPEPHVLTTQDV